MSPIRYRPAHRPLSILLTGCLVWAQVIPPAVATAADRVWAEVTMLAPADGTRTNHTALDVTIAFSATKGNVKLIQLLLDGRVVAAFDNPPHNKSGTHLFQAVDLSAFANTGSPVRIEARAYQGNPQANHGSISPPVFVVVDTLPPAVTITDPADGTLTTLDHITISGTVDDQTASVTVNGILAAIVGTHFTANVSLQPGANLITAVAETPTGETGSASIDVQFDPHPPQVPQVTSRVFSDTDERYPSGEIVRIDVDVPSQAPKLVSGSLRIASASQGYNSGLQPLTIGSAFFQWNTSELAPASDYVVQARLVDAQSRAILLSPSVQPSCVFTDAAYLTNPPQQPVNGWPCAQSLTTQVAPVQIPVCALTLSCVPISDSVTAPLIITLELNPPAPNKLVSTTDVQVPARGLPTEVVRTYLLNSSFDGPLGFGWTHTYLMHVVETPDGLVKIFDADGSAIYFKRQSDGTYQLATRQFRPEFRTLTKSSDGRFQLRQKDGTQFLFFSITSPLPMNPPGKLAAIHDRNNNHASLVYDAMGRLHQVLDPSGQATSFAYDANGRLASILDPAGRTVSYNYDGAGNLVEVTDAGGGTTLYAYDANHNLTMSTDPTGRRTFLTTDARDRLESISSEGAQNRLVYQYSDTVPEMTVTDALGHSTVLTYDNRSLVTQITDPLGHITRKTFDGDLNLTSFTDPNGHTTALTYDARGNILMVTDARNKLITLTYEPSFNQVASLMDQNGRMVDFARDGLGNLTQIQYPGGLTETFTYDSAGHLTSRTDRKGQTITFTRDARGLLTAKSFPDTSSHSFAYDTAGNLISATDQQGMTQFTYDALDRLTSVHSPGGKVVSYLYDDAGRRTRLTYPDASLLDYDYDPAGRLSQIRQGGQVVAGYLYDAMSRRAQRALRNGVVSTSAYDAAGRLIDLTNRKPDGSVLSQFSYTYDGAGNRLTMTTLDGTTHYTYDEINQLTKVVEPDGATTEYAYDGAGNRTAVVENGTPTPYTTDPLNQYTTVGADSYTYDANGSPVTKATPSGTTTYAYDFENRLVQATTPTETIAYAYDAFGRRVGKTTSAGTTRYLHDDFEVIMETDGTNSTQAVYQYGDSLDEALVMTRGGMDHYYTQDGLGSVTDLTSSTGAPVESYTYDAYGKPNITTRSVDNPYLFTGREFDPEVGLYYARARYYDPSLGRFLTPDPIGFAGGSHLYTYVGNNPVNLTDPRGENPLILLGVIVLAAGVLATSYVFCCEDAVTRWKNKRLEEKEKKKQQQTAATAIAVASVIPLSVLLPVLQGDPTFIQPTLGGVQLPTLLNGQKAHPRHHTHGLIAEIHVPYAQALVRAKVPIFGVAYGKDFKRYRVEYGEGRNPRTWTMLATSTTPQTNAVTPEDLDDSVDRAMRGNLATWDTGLRNYVSGSEDLLDHSIDLKGPYTVRLVVENAKGQTAEDRVTVEVGDVIPNIYGGTVTSSDGQVRLSVPEQAIRDSFRVFSIQPLKVGEVPAAKQQKILGAVYEFKPAGERFTKDVTLELTLPRAAQKRATRLGLYAYDTGSKQWSDLPTIVDQARGVLATTIRALPEEGAYVAVLRQGWRREERSISPVWSGNFKAPYRPMIPPHPTRVLPIMANAPTNDAFIWNNFEDGVGEWTNRDGDVGAGLSLNNTATLDGGFCLQLTNLSYDGNFASTITSQPFDAARYPIVQFDYKIAPEVKINLLVKLDDRWYDIEFTDDPKAYRRLNMERIGRIAGVKTDNQWHTASLNLYDMLRQHPPLAGRDRYVVQEMIMADWDDVGYMKLVYGHNRKGATYDIDNFMIRSDGAGSARTPQGLASVVAASRPAAPLVSAVSVPRDSQKNAAHPGLVIEEFQQSASRFGFEWRAFQKEGAQGFCHSSIDHDRTRGSVLKLAYDVSREGDFAGYYGLLHGFDASAYRTLSFWIRGAQGQEGIRVGLKNTNGQESQVLVGQYLDNGISQSWQKVSLPLLAFAGIKNISSVENISFLVEERFGAQSGVVWIDHIAFEPDVMPIRVGGCANPQAVAASGESFVFKTSMASIEARPDPFGCFIRYSGIVSERDRESWAGWGVNLRELDASGYETVTFQVRRIHGMEKPHVYLEDDTRRAYVNLEDYVLPSADWQTIRIPLREFARRGVNLHHLQRLVFVLEWERTEGAFYLDDLRFEPPATMDRSSPSIIAHDSTRVGDAFSPSGPVPSQSTTSASRVQ